MTIDDAGSDATKIASELGERLKELRCLYGVFKIIGDPAISLEETLRRSASFIPTGWRYSDTACARIVVREDEYVSEEWTESAWKEGAPITIDGKAVGKVEVAYRDPPHDCGEAIFLEEEQYLLTAIADLLGRYVQHEYLKQERDQLSKDLQTALTKVISGFVPICASCKSIRDEQENWLSVEEYVQQRSTAQFSHGICPICFKKLYPDYAMK